MVHASVGYAILHHGVQSCSVIRNESRDSITSDNYDYNKAERDS